MAISERERHVLHQALDELMDPDVADTLMKHLPPGGWGNVATTHDLAELEDRLTHRFDAMLMRHLTDLRTEMHGEIGSLRSEMHGELGSLRAEIGSLRSEMHDELGSLRSEIGGLSSELGSVRSDMQAMTRTYILGNIALVFTVAAIAFGAARLV